MLVGRSRSAWAAWFLVVAAACGAAACARDRGKAAEEAAKAPEEVRAPRPAAADPSPDGPYVRVLGTAQDGGLPHAACSCPRCEAARHDPARRRWVASIAIVLPNLGRVVIVDATPDIRAQLDALADVRDAPAGSVDRSPVDGVFLTHAHLGHYTGLGFLGFEAVHAEGTPVHATPELIEFLQANAPWSDLFARGEVVAAPLAPGGSVSLGEGVTVEALRVPHRDEHANTVAFVVRGPTASLLYAPDTDRWEGWNPAPETVIAGVDVALVDGTFYSGDELPGRDVSAIGHPLVRDSIRRLAPLVESAGVSVLFTHLNHSNPLLDPGSDALRSTRARGFEVATDGMTFPL